MAEAAKSSSVPVMEDSAHQWLKHQSPQNHPVYLYLRPRASINTSPKLQPDQSLLVLGS